MRVTTTWITVRTETITLIRRSGAERSWCRHCAAEVEVVAVDAKALAEILDGTVRSAIESGELHVFQDPDRPARTCLPSLIRCFGPNPIKTSKETL